MSAVRPMRMSAGLRAALYATFGLLWLSGCGWLALHEFFEPVTEFGPTPHPWEPVLLRVHGVIAVAGDFLLGWMSPVHVVERWRQRRKMTSGIVTAATAALLVLSGYALYYFTDRAHTASSMIHETIGAAAIVVALIHWRRFTAAGQRPRNLTAPP
jgi:hypothetical protein